MIVELLSLVLIVALFIKGMDILLNSFDDGMADLVKVAIFFIGFTILTFTIVKYGVVDSRHTVKFCGVVKEKYSEIGGRYSTYSDYFLIVEENGKREYIKVDKDTWVNHSIGEKDCFTYKKPVEEGKTKIELLLD